MATSLLTCEISGESLAASSDSIVVTPSGHVCLKRLLLAKLAENGGVDPFDAERPLSEDDLIELAASSSKTNKSSSSIIPPRPNAATSYTNLLQLAHQEYDAVVLELFDTRQALQSTRQELSQSLYQNDAAVRVIARLAKERDEARRQLMTMTQTGRGVDVATANDEQQQDGTDNVVESKTPLPQKRDHDDDTMDASAATERLSKKPRTEPQEQDDEAALPLANDIPPSDLTDMIAKWDDLHKHRKASQKQAAAQAPSAEQLAQLTDHSTAWHKTTCKTMSAVVTATIRSADTTTASPCLITSGSDKQVICYDTTTKAVAWTISKMQASHLHCLAGDGKNNLLVTAQAKTLSAFQIGDNADVSDPVTTTTPSTIVGVQWHPSGRHVLACTQQGLLLYRTKQSLKDADADDDDAPLQLQHISTFAAVTGADDKDTVKLTCGYLHPDGLIYIAGTDAGDLQIWDLKSKLMAGTLAGLSSAIVKVVISDNGYHIASVTHAGAVVVWDLRKQAIVATLNDNKSELDSVVAVAFDPSGKYLAYGGAKGIRVSAVKEWGITASFDAAADFLAWAGSATIVSASKKGRQVHMLE